MQTPHQSALEYINQMHIASAQIVHQLGGRQKALEMAIDGLNNTQLQRSLREEMERNNMVTFSQCLKTIEYLQETKGIGIAIQTMQAPQLQPQAAHETSGGSKTTEEIKENGLKRNKQGHCVDQASLNFSHPNFSEQQS